MDRKVPVTRDDLCTTAMDRLQFPLVLQEVEDDTD